MKTVVDLAQIINRDTVAVNIGNVWQQWKQARSDWEKEKREIRNYVFATDTRKTTNSQLPWKNTTTRPKLCQIRDNLHANYMAALFPHEDWFTWLANDREGSSKQKRDVIMQYMKNKLINSDFRNEISKCVLDYIDYGNCFAEVVHVNETHTLADGEVVSVYKGPRIRRISPFDIVFDLTAQSFKDTAKVTRTLVTLGQLKKMLRDQPHETGWITNALERAEQVRSVFTTGGVNADIDYKNEAYTIDGFGSLVNYYRSGTVEVLTFEGDLYDMDSGTLYENHRIIVIDRAIVAYMAPYESWLGRSNKEHAGWRLRPDALLAMGPLDNLVGMQYRIDHLENLKADVFDQIAHPVVKQKGYVEDWQWGPGERLYMDIDADVEVLRPDSTALTADMQISVLEEQMEEFAGAPRQAMGIRTPGEKTAYEVQILENAAGRIFQNKVQYFEEVFLEPLLNQYLAAGRQYIDVTDQIRVQDSDVGVVEFINVTKEDLNAKGKLVPMGARHFARKAQLVQNLTNFVQSGVGQDPLVKAHISGYEIAKLFEELLGIERFKLVRKNVAVAEQFETQALAQEANRQMMEEGLIDPEMEELDPDEQAELAAAASGE